MRSSNLFAKLVMKPLLREVDKKNPGSGCAILFILIIIAILCAILGIGNYE